MIKVNLNSNNELSCFFLVINTIFLALLHNNIFVRGAISYGKHKEIGFNSEYVTGKVVVSPALIKAYTLESEKAIYSRIIIDKSFFKYINTNNADLTKKIIDINIFVVDKQDNMFILTLDLKPVDEKFLKKYEDKYKEYHNNDDKEERIALKYKYMLDLVDFQKSNYETNQPNADFKFRRMRESDFI